VNGSDTARRFARLIHPWIPRIVAGSLAAAACGGVYILVPIVLRYVVDAMASGDPHARKHAIALGIAAMVVITIAQAAFSYVQSMLLAAVNAGMMRELRRRLVEHILCLPLRVSGGERVGVFIGRYSSDVPVIVALATGTIPALMRNGSLVVGLIAVLVCISWQLSIVSALTVVGVAFTAQRLVGRTATLSRPLQTVRSDALAVVGEVIANIALIRAFGRQAFINTRVREHLDAAYGLSIDAARLSALSQSSVNVVGGLLMCGIVWLGANGALSGGIALGTVFAYLGAAGMLAGALGTLCANVNSVAAAAASVERYLNLLAAEPECDGPPGVEPPLRGALRFEGVSFAFRDDVAVLRNVTLDIPAGTSLALIGPSGAGKSTILQLVLAAFSPQQGRILIDGQDLATISKTWLRDRIGYVPQEPYVFAGTVAQNLRFGKPHASDADLWNACRIARFDTVLARLAGGLEELVGERGSTLSRGEAQRLAIARMVLRDPAIVLLDEATASLDSENERLVLEALGESLRGRTTISVTHRLEGAIRSDAVALLYDGRIVEHGAPADLLRNAGMFGGLVAAVNRPSELATPCR
jgi:ABC-type multidrug transport system fused ATPase/permease subunit